MSLHPKALSIPDLAVILGFRLQELAFGCCYGIDFYRPDYSFDFGVLMLIADESTKSVSEYIDELTQYVRFDPDFKLE